jgi:drug/metabolite transporter (DMT)-like permease
MQFAVLAALGAMVCWGIGDFFIQRTARKIGNVEALAWISLAGTLLLLPFLIGDIARLTLLQDLVLVVVLAIITFFAAILNFEALREGKLSVIDMVISLELPLTIILGVFFLHERLTLLQFLLIALLMVGISMISVARGRLHFRFERGVWFALAAALGMALVNYLTAVSSMTISPLMAVWAPWAVLTVLTLLVLYRRDAGLGKFFSHLRSHPRLIITMSVFDTAAWLCFAYAVASADLGITTAITQGYPVVALFLGVMIGKERITARQYLGAGVVMVSAIALALLI